MRILVAQMTRMGDVLQTSPLIRSLKQRFPDAHITAMVRRMGKPIAECNPDIDEIWVYEEDDIFLDLRADDSDRLLQAYMKADAIVRRLRDGRYDVVYNCTHSLCSAMLFKLAEIPRVVGAHLSDDWRFVWRGLGPNYFLTSVLHRDTNDLNLCDMFRFFLEDAPPTNGLVMQVDDRSRLEARALLAAHGIGDSDFLACFQLGASDKDKRWPAPSFAELGRLMKERHQARVALVGVENEAPLGQTFEAHAPGLAAHLFGKTTIPQLAALLQRAHVLVTNDTGTMHIAAAVGCPIVLTSVGYVHFRETGPYGAGHCAVERRRSDVGRSDIRRSESAPDSGILPAHVLRAVDLVLEGQTSRTPPRIEDSDELSAIDLFWSAFAPDGCLEWYPVIRREPASTDLLRAAYRMMWLERFQGAASAEHRIAGLKQMLASFRLDDTACLRAWADETRESIRGLGARAEKGAAMTERLLAHLRGKGSMREAKSLVADMIALDEEMRVYGEIHRACRPLVAIARFERDNLEGSDPLPLAERTLEIYNDIRTRAEALMASIAAVGRMV
ncbi:MAG: hypothetical protein AMXMBFR4_20590 [Candidatus Hydrogenedentota bacterium]